MSKPTLKEMGDAHRFTWSEYPGTAIELERFRESRGDLTAEITITHPDGKGNPGLLHFGKLNLLANTRSQLARKVAEREPNVDWAGLLEQVCLMAVDRYRNGEPVVDLRKVEPDLKPRWLLYPYIERGGPTILAAPGGVGKSMLALAMAYSIASGYALLGRLDNGPTPVLYLDYETTADVHAERLRALASGLGGEIPEIYYRRMAAGLLESINFVRKEVARLDIGCIIIDSLGYAGGGDPKDAATAIELFRAVRQIDTPCLAIHHQRKTPPGVKASKGVDAIYGSVYFINSARRVWQISATEPDEFEDTKYLSMTNTKANNGRLERTHALRMDIENDNNDRLTSIRLTPHRISDIPELAEDLSLKQRILIELNGGAQNRNDLADVLDTTPGTISKTLSQLKKAGRVVQVDDGLWGRVAESY